MTASRRESDHGQNFLDRALQAIFSFGSGREGSPQRQAYEEIVKAQREGKLPPGANLDVLYNKRLEQLMREGGGMSIETGLETIAGKKPEEKSEEKPAESEPPTTQGTELPGRPPRYEGDGQTGQDATTLPGTLRDINQAYIDLQKQIYGDLPGLITQAGEENRRTIEATSAAAKEREVIAQWGATQRAMVQRDAAMALGLMNTAYLANTPNVSLMQQLNAPLAAVASNYKLQMPGGSK
mgnify:FL=1